MDDGAEFGAARAADPSVSAPGRSGGPQSDAPPPSPRGSGYIPQLDGLRAIAVVFVILFHTQPQWFPGGYLGVDIFFVLSGFLITGILLREFDRTGRIAFGRFYVRRALRLLPALLLLAVVLCIAYLVVLSPDEREESILAVLAAVGYATSPLAAGGADMGSMLHAWSLSVEEYFYVLWPLGLIVILRLTRRSRAWIAVAGVTAAAVAYRLIVVFVGWPWERVYYAADTRSEQLLIGCLFAFLVADRRLRAKASLALPALLVLCLLVVVPQPILGPVYVYGGSTVIALIAAVLIASLVVTPARGVARLLSLKPFLWIGKRSYGIYLWHAPAAALIAMSLPEWVPLLPADIVLTFAIAAVSYRFVEQPFLRMKVRFGPRSARATPQASP